MSAHVAITGPAEAPGARAQSEPPFARLWRMNRAGRVAAMWRGDLTFGECQAWSRRRPDEVPLIGGEFAYIVVRMPEWRDE